MAGVAAAIGARFVVGGHFGTKFGTGAKSGRAFGFPNHEPAKPICPAVDR